MNGKKKIKLVSGLMRTSFMILILMGSLYVESSYAQSFAAPETRGVWAPANFSPSDPAGTELLMKNISSANFNVVYVGVWSPRTGSTIYPSNVMKNAGGPIQSPGFTGDPLRTYIDIAHKYGIDVIAWFEQFPLTLSIGPTNPPAVLAAHPDWSYIQRDTTKHYVPSGDGYRYGIDPSVTGAAEFTVNLFTELAKNYPDLDGIETDIEDDTTISYSDTARIRFMEETGKPDPLTLPANNSDWLSWRRLQITNLVRGIYDGIKSVNPECLVTGAVPPPYMSNYMLETWNTWAQNGYVDMLEPMLYLNTSDFDQQMSLSESYVPKGFQLSPGIAINSAGSVSNTIYEIKDARTRHVAGVAIWYYGYLLSYANAISQLKSAVFATKTLPSFDDLLIDNSSPGEFRSTGSWTTESGGYQGNYMSGSAAPGDTAIFSVRILRSANYALYGYWSGDSASNCANATLSINSSILSKTDTIDQRSNLNSWSYIDKFHLNSGDTVTLKLAGTGSGNLIADAFRLRRGTPFTLGDYAVPDSQTILLKFSNSLLATTSSPTTIISSSTSTVKNFFVDPLDNTILHVIVSPLQRGAPCTLNVNNLLDVFHDTLSLSQTLEYDPDSTTFMIDDQTPGAFLKLSGTWLQDTSSSAVNGEYWLAKQSSQVARIEWGPLQIKTDGYYDVYVNIPAVQYSLSDNCVYLVTEHFGTDSVRVSQASAAGTWLKLENCPLRSGDQFAVLVSSMPGANTSEYLVADAVMIRRSVETTGIKKAQAPLRFDLGDNYPNPFNPSTTIRVSLAKTGKMSLKIYNTLGQMVKVVDEGIKPAGEYTYNVSMSNFASGVYFYRLDAGDTFITKKMMLVK